MISISRADLSRLVEMFIVTVRGAVDENGLRVLLSCDPPRVERALLSAMSTVTDAYVKPADVVIFGADSAPKTLSSAEVVQQMLDRTRYSGRESEEDALFHGLTGESSTRSALLSVPLTVEELAQIEADAAATVDSVFKTKMTGHPRAYMEFVEPVDDAPDLVHRAAYRVFTYREPETAVAYLLADMKALRVEATARGPGDPVLIFRRKMEVRQEQDFSTGKWRFQLNLRVAAVPGAWAGWDVSVDA